MTDHSSSWAPQPPTTFFKYCSTSTALSVIGTSSLRWSAPSRFNDPFDVPLLAQVDFTLSDLREALDREHLRLLETLDETLHPRIRQIQDALRSQPRETRAEVIREYLAAQRITDPPSSDSLSVLTDVWRVQAAQLRILCLSESNDSASMWDRYADGHRGVVLELGYHDRIDNALVRARPVHYQDESPKLPGVEWWAKAITLQPSVDFTSLWAAYFYTKRSDWRTEREWRVVTYAQEGETGDFSDYPMAPRDLLSVYIGYKAREGEVAALTRALAAAHAHTKVYRTRLDHAAGKLIFRGD